MLTFTPAGKAGLSDHCNSEGCTITGLCSLVSGSAAIDAAGRAALGSAESANVQIQLQESSAESVSVHSQHWGSLRLVPIGVAKDSENELLSKFSDSFGIADSCPIHLQHYGIKFGASRK